MVIGKGGETIRGLEADYEVQIDIEEDGTILIYATDGDEGRSRHRGDRGADEGAGGRGHLHRQGRQDDAVRRVRRAEEGHRRPAPRLERRPGPRRPHRGRDGARRRRRRRRAGGRQGARPHRPQARREARERRPRPAGGADRAGEGRTAAASGGGAPAPRRSSRRRRRRRRPAAAASRSTREGGLGGPPLVPSEEVRSGHARFDADDVREGPGRCRRRISHRSRRCAASSRSRGSFGPTTTSRSSSVRSRGRSPSRSATRPSRSTSTGPAWDDFECTTVHGSHEARGRPARARAPDRGLGAAARRPLPRRGAYFVPAGEFDWSKDGGDFYVPDRASRASASTRGIR